MMTVKSSSVGQMKLIEFTTTRVVVVVVAEADQITCWASLVQGIQMVASDSQRLTPALEAAVLAMVVAIAGLRMDLTIQTSPECYSVSSRK